jgi:uncharacterized protein YceK
LGWTTGGGRGKVGNVKCHDWLHRIPSIILLCGMCFLCGCAAIASRIGCDRNFSGVRCDYAMVFNRSSIDPSSRMHPVLAIIDSPFSFVGDILFLPLDVYEDCEYSQKHPE